MSQSRKRIVTPSCCVGSSESESEFKEFKPRHKYSWFHFKLYQIFQDLSRRLIETVKKDLWKNVNDFYN